MPKEAGAWKHGHTLSRLLDAVKVTALVQRAKFSVVVNCPDLLCCVRVLCAVCQVSELLTRGLADVEERASELSQRQERLLNELTHSSNSMTAAMKQQQ